MVCRVITQCHSFIDSMIINCGLEHYNGISIYDGQEIKNITQYDGLPQ